jgi:hypothetical protein
MALLTLWLACTGSTGGAANPPEGDTDTDTDADTDTDTDADSDSDTDTDTVTTEPGWQWGTVVGVGAADASFVGEKNDATGMLLAPGDIDGNGHDDLLVCALGDFSDDSGSGSSMYVLHDGRTEWSMDMPVTDLPSVFGTDDYEINSPVVLGDINGDGSEDFYMSRGGASPISVILGSPTLGEPPRSVEDPDVIVTLDAADHDLGWYLAGVVAGGDVDGDGLDDLLSASNVRQNEGYVVAGAALLDGTASVPADASLVVHGHDDFNPWFRAAGDVTGDGFDDIFGYEYDAARIWLFHGAADGLPHGEEVASAADATIAANDGGYISLLNPLGDVDGDSASDFAVDVAYGPAGRGSHLFFGGAGIEGIMAPDDGKFTFARGRDALSGASLGDINGDGHTDVSFIMAPGKGWPDSYVVLGFDDWPSDVAAEDADIRIPCEGKKVYTSGRSDINGDGLDDLIAAERPDVPGWGTTISGFLHVFVGDSAPLPALLPLSDADVTFMNESDGSMAPGFLVMDLDVDGFDDILVPRMESEVFGIYDGTLYIHFGQPGP